MRKLLLLLAVFLASCASVAADPPRYTVVKVDLRSEKLELFLNDDAGVAFKRFDRLEAWLKAHDRQLVFAVNAGMYHADFSPVGLFVRDGREESPLNLANGVGNFFLKPNGVFLVSDAGPRVIEASEYPALAKRGLHNVQLATQSGPLLLRRGVLHPALIPNSDSRKIRNGVGVSGHTAIFVLSETPVNFYDFALYFRDVLHCRDALYLDGTVSALHSKALQRSDFVRDLGPILGVALP